MTGNSEMIGSPLNKLPIMMGEIPLGGMFERIPHPHTNGDLNPAGIIEETGEKDAPPRSIIGEKPVTEIIEEAGSLNRRTRITI